MIIRADAAVTDLRRFKRRRFYHAGDGKHGSGKKKQGKRGEDLVLTVPVGTLVSDKTAVGGDSLIADLEQPGQQVVVARGGRGGWGNARFATATNQAPQIAQKGEPGEERAIILEMRLIADVGIIGYPNVGKSTLLAATSAAHPQIASYPFTTLEPALGVVEVGHHSFTLAEIPGLVADAHRGRGLGHDFLRHVMRTRVLLHLLDGSSPSPVEDMAAVNAELSLFDSSLARKPQLVVVNKSDLPEVQARLAQIKRELSNTGVDAYFISAATGQGVAELMAATLRLLETVRSQQEEEPGMPRRVFRPPPKVSGIRVYREGDTYVVVAPGLERIVTRGNASAAEVRGQLRRYLARRGVNRALEKAGVKPGDRVRCGNLEWEW